MEAAEHSEGGGDGTRATFDSVALTTALAADQVKESGRKPTERGKHRTEGRERDIGILRQNGSDTTKH